jgi:hypothetical protein
MKAQIAIIAGGLAIAAGVAYAELKPSNTVAGQSTQAPAPVQSNTAPHTPLNTAPQNSAPAPTSKLTNPNSGSHVQAPTGRGGEGERGGEGGEHGFLGFGGGEDD